MDESLLPPIRTKPTKVTTDPNRLTVMPQPYVTPQPCFSKISEPFGKSHRFRIQDETTRGWVFDKISELTQNRYQRGQRYEFPGIRYQQWKDEMWGTSNFYCCAIPRDAYRFMLLFTVWNNEYHCFMVDESNQCFFCPIRAPRGEMRENKKDVGYYNGTVLDGLYFGGDYLITDAPAMYGKSYKRLNPELRGLPILFASMQLNELNADKPDYPLNSISGCTYTPIDLSARSDLLILSEQHEARRYVRVL